MSDKDGVTKLPKLIEADDFVNWRHRVKAYLQTKDINLLGPTTRLEEESALQQRRWLEASIKA